MEKNSVEIYVRFNEVDHMGVVHNSVYYIWFEIARYNFAQKGLGITYEKMSKKGTLVPVIHSQCQYIKPVRFPDIILIACFYEPSEKNILILHYLVFSKTYQTKVSYGKTINAFTHSDGTLMLAMPDILREGLNKIDFKNAPFIWHEEYKKINFINELGALFVLQ